MKKKVRKGQEENKRESSREVGGERKVRGLTADPCLFLYVADRLGYIAVIATVANKGACCSPRSPGS